MTVRISMAQAVLLRSMVSSPSVAVASHYPPALKLVEMGHAEWIGTGRIAITESGRKFIGDEHV